jgi:DNA polymerase I-like protein with 3'-5' exonuclease and polymerase domains
VVGAGQNIWGGAFTENIAQALARIILTRAELTLARCGLPAALQVHDELVFKVPTAITKKVIGAIAKVMTRKVDFLPDLPIAVEIHDGPTYGDAK